MGSDAVAGLQFRILGPLEVTRDGERLSPGGDRQRALLALLLVNANQLVTKERLVEELFADQPSASAVGALRVAVSRLRQALDAEGVLETQPGGYVLRVASDRLDAAQFEALHRRGRELMAAGCRRRRRGGIAAGAPRCGADRRSPTSRWSRACRERFGGSTSCDCRR